MKDKKRVVLIGLDGATWDLIKPWADKGKLPTFKYLMENGAWGTLQSTIPPLSPSAWTSIYTGCTPSKHGIFGFMKRKKGSYFYTPISSKDRKKPAVWGILSGYGKRVVVINALFSYPPEKVNGILITGLGTPSKESNFVHPPEYKKLILDKFPNYDVDFNEDFILVSENIREFIARIREITFEQIKLTEYLLEHERWDFLFSIFRALDVIQHYFWDDKHLIFEFYAIFDRFLREILDSMVGDDYLFVVSDHGFSRVERYFCVNNWLERIGLLKWKMKRKRSLITAEKVKYLLLKLGLRSFVWKMKRSDSLERFLKIFPSEEFNHVSIDWSRTRAYFLEGSDGIICINLTGREPQGIVSENEYQKVVRYIVSELEKLRDEKTGERVVERIVTKGEICEVNCKDLPDIFVLLNRKYRAVGCNKIDNSIFMPPVHGKAFRPADHDINGIFVAFGHKAISGRLKYKVKPWDVAPTILNIFGLPAESMDGHALTFGRKNFA